MTYGYCQYHKFHMSPDDMIVKSCRKKNKSGKKCKHLRENSNKLHYRNQTGRKKGCIPR